MIDLCIDARMAFSSGIGTCIRQLTPYLSEPPFKTTLLVDQEGQEWCKKFEQIVFPASIYSLKEQALYPRKIPRCDLFWSPHYNIPLLPIRAKKRIVTIHDACHLALGKFLSFPERVYAKFVMGRALHGSDAAVTDSFFSQKELIRFLGRPRKDLEVIPVAVDKRQFRRIEKGSILEEIKKKYRLPEKFLLFVGNLKPHKNLSGLVQAFQNLSLGKDWGLVIIGKRTGLRNGDGNREGAALLTLEDVSDADLPAIYSLAEVFAFPSFYEGFGLPPLEAMSCGCPTIVSQAASLPEVCGDAAFYVNPENSFSISEAIHNVISNQSLRKNLVEKGFERVKKFEWADTASRYRKLFEEVHRA